MSAARQSSGGGRSPLRPRRLPALNDLADEVRAAANTTVADSLNTILGRRPQLQRFDSVEDLGEAAYGDNPDRDARALAFHLEGIRNQLGEALWPRGIFIGPSVLDDLLFYAARDPQIADPLLAALEYLRDRRANRPGLIVFPLHSLGVLGAGLLLAGRRSHVQFIHPEWGLAVTPQTNKMRATLAFLERARQDFGVRKPIDGDLLEHWYRSRARWLERNPVLAVRFVSQRGSYYDTELFVVGRVQAATSVLAMVATFQPQRGERAGFLFSSSQTNNWETLDLHARLATRLGGDSQPRDRL